MRTAQELFDAIVSGLREQGGQSLDEMQLSCAYRGENGRKCAVGQVLPDPSYNPAMEGMGLKRLLDSGLLPPATQEEFDLHQDLLREMQNIHDGVAYVSDWEYAFRDAAERFDLTYSPPTTATQP